MLYIITKYAANALQLSTLSSSLGDDLVELNALVLALVLRLPNELIDCVVPCRKMRVLHAEYHAKSHIALDDQLVLPENQQEAVISDPLAFELWFEIIDSFVCY